jgi:TPR repeat protein
MRFRWLGVPLIGLLLLVILFTRPIQQLTSPELRFCAWMEIPECHMLLSLRYQEQGEPIKAVFHSEQAAQKHFPAALIDMGNRSRKGDGVAKNAARAYDFYKQAAEKYPALAPPALFVALWQMQTTGDGVQADPEKAFLWAKEAAIRLSLPACMAMADKAYASKKYKESASWLHVIRSFEINMPDDERKAVAALLAKVQAKLDKDEQAQAEEMAGEIQRNQLKRHMAASAIVEQQGVW